LGDNRFSGTCFALTVITVVVSCAAAILYLARYGGYWAEGFVTVALTYFGLSTRSLAVENRKIYLALAENDLESARTAVGMVVGRETGSLDEKEICRASVETLAEGSVDGVVSPLFYLFIAGVPGLALFKAVSTLDSMVGYKNEKYIRFGWASARLDDLANLIPARLSVLFISLASLITAGRARPAFAHGVGEGSLLESPNAGYPEAAFAGALGVRLGGENRYHGKIVVKPILNETGDRPGKEHILRSIRLMTVTAVISFLFLFGIWYTVGQLTGSAGLYK
jgi:adenosylcobinamide-phosphate synthase